VILARRETLSKEIYQYLRFAFIGADGVPRGLNDLTAEDRQAVFDGKITGHHYWMREKSRSAWIENGEHKELIVKEITTEFY
jgi:hypothetical protein